MYCYVTNQEIDIIFKGMLFNQEKFCKDLEVIKRESKDELAQSLGEKNVEFSYLKDDAREVYIPVCKFDGIIFKTDHGDIILDDFQTQVNFFQGDRKPYNAIYSPNYPRFAVREEDNRPIDPYQKIVYISKLD